MTEHAEQLWSDLPAHWEVAQVKNVATVTLGKMLQSTDTGADVLFPYLRAANVQPDGVLDLADAKEMWFSPAEVAALTVEPGDVVVVEGGQGGFGRAAHVPDGLSGWGFQNSINRLRPNNRGDGRYLTYYLIALRASGFLRAYCNVISMPHLTTEKLAALPVPLPPQAEQQAIADYLDRETATIDTLIEEQQRLIDLLSERRTAIIERVVTHGLDPTVQLQTSSLPWTDSLPEHWTVGNIRRFAQMKTGHTPSRSHPEYWEDCSTPWFTLSDVWQLRSGSQMYLGETSHMISDLGLANSAAELLPARTVVLSRTASVGFSGVMPTPMATSQDFWNWVCGHDLVPEYLVWTFRAMRPAFQSLMIGSTHQTIYQPVAAGMHIPVPPVDEQEAIVDFLDDQTTRIDTLIAEAERFIDLAKERRSALITAAVTGQIDVREDVA